LSFWARTEIWSRNCGQWQAPIGDCQCMDLHPRDDRSLSWSENRPSLMFPFWSEWRDESKMFPREQWPDFWWFDFENRSLSSHSVHFILELKYRVSYPSMSIVLYRLGWQDLVAQSHAMQQNYSWNETSGSQTHTFSKSLFSSDSTQFRSCLRRRSFEALPSHYDIIVPSNAELISLSWWYFIFYKQNYACRNSSPVFRFWKRGT
jgi:hypothetical protein